MAAPAKRVRVAVVGLGAMGSRMAGRLLDRGHEVVVWNRDATKGEPLVAAGATAAASPAEAAGAAEAIITMVTDGDALAAVTEGEQGVLAGAAPGTVLLQMSTVGVEATNRLAAAADGIELVDAPVLGSISEVEGGTLTIYAGGDASAVDRVEPLLGELGTVVRVGGIGAGSAAKLVANAVLVGVIGVLGESLALGRGLGLPQDVAFDVLETTALAEQARRRRPAVESGEYPPRFALPLARKDADLVAQTGLDLRVLGAAREWLADAETAGLAGRDYSAVLAHILAQA